MKKERIYNMLNPGQELFVKAKILNVHKADEIYKVITNSGEEFYVSETDTIPCIPFKSGKDCGQVMVGGENHKASKVRMVYELFLGISQQYEDLKKIYENKQKGDY